MIVVYKTLNVPIPDSAVMTTIDDPERLREIITHNRRDDIMLPENPSIGDLQYFATLAVIPKRILCEFLKNGLLKRHIKTIILIQKQLKN